MKKWTLALALGGFLAMLVLTSCGSSGKDGSSGPSSGNTFELSEFEVTPPTNALHPGRVVIAADNVGGEVHELVIVRAESVSDLPKKPDGSVDEGKIAAADKVGELEDIASRSSKNTTLELRAGDYVAFCNLIDSMTGADSAPHGGHDSEMGSASGHVHFAEGMAVPFSVT